MEQTIYFQDKSLTFSSMKPKTEGYVIPASEASSLSRAKVLKIFESHNSVTLPTSDPQAAFAAFAGEFTMVEAAGGVAVNPRGEWLMIRRNERWDLPKGHLEANEQIAHCAVREVSEECGISGLVLGEKIAADYLEKNGYKVISETQTNGDVWYMVVPE